MVQRELEFLGGLAEATCTVSIVAPWGESFCSSLLTWKHPLSAETPLVCAFSWSFLYFRGVAYFLPFQLFCKMWRYRVPHLTWPPHGYTTEVLSHLPTFKVQPTQPCAWVKPMVSPLHPPTLHLCIFPLPASMHCPSFKPHLPLNAKTHLKAHHLFQGASPD